MKNRIISLIVVSIIIIFLMSPVEVEAYNVMNHKLKGGINGRNYYLKSSVKDDVYWSNVFVAGFQRWTNTSTSFSFSKTTSSTKGIIYCNTYYNTTDFANGYTTYIYDGSKENDWKGANIYLNKFYLQSTLADVDIGVAGHEIGHAIGLDHADGNVLMTTTDRGRTVTYPQRDDINGVNSIYKYGTK